MLESLVEDTAREPDGSPALRVIDGREAAFRRLADRDLDSGYRLAGVILGDAFEAEDAVHDAAVAAWRAFPSLRDHAAFEGWFRRILVNECRDRLRARARRRVVDLGREVVDGEHPRIPDPSEAAAARDAVGRALDALDPEHRVVVVLRFHADLTVPVIAATLGIPEGTVKSRLHHALERLRAAMPEEGR